MKVEHHKTSDLIPYANNAKKHDEAQIAKIASSIREYGFNNPVLIDGNKPAGIIAGHGRVMAAQKLGLEKVPCIRLEHLSEAQKRAYILADNRLAEIGGGWDKEVLKVELEQVESELFNDLFNEYETQTKAETIEDVQALENIASNQETPGNYEKAISSNSQQCALPIVPKYLEKHNAFIIICDNEIDEAFIRQKLNLNEQHKCYKGVKTRLPNVLSVTEFRKKIQ